MTRPAEVKVREEATPGTRCGAFEVGATMPEVSFTTTPEIIDEYITAVEGDEELYVVDGRKAAPPDFLCVYMTSVLYRKYPPIQANGSVTAKIKGRERAVMVGKATLRDR